MPHEKERRDETPEPQAKRTGRDSADARNQPAEFADDLRTNRFTPPPDVDEEK
jgi:hypothetical protein